MAARANGTFFPWELKMREFWDMFEEVQRVQEVQGRWEFQGSMDVQGASEVQEIW